MYSLVSRVLVASAAVSSFLVAQTTYVSPPQLLNVEGSSSSGITFTNPKTRTQQIDSNLIGTNFLLIRSLAFRRTNIHSRAGSGARKADVQIDFGYGIATPTNNFDTNYQTKTRRTVFPKKNVSLPDWTGATTRPAPFDLVFNFTAPFIYNNKDSLIWDVLVDKNTGGGTYYMDWTSTPPAVTKGTTPVALGKGCTTKNGTFTHTSAFTADATNLMLGWSCTGAPANTSVLPALGLSDPNTAIGWCTNLRTDALLLLPVAQSNAAGAATASIPAPWQPVFRGVMLYTQLAANDVSQQTGIALSNGLMGSTPYAKGGGTGAAFKIQRIYSTSGHGPMGTLATSAAPVRYAK